LLALPFTLRGGTVPDIAKLKHKLGSLNVKKLAETAHKSIKQAASKHMKKMKAGLKSALGGAQLKEEDQKAREGLKGAKNKLGSFNVKELAENAHESIKEAASKHHAKMKEVKEN